MAKIEKGDRFGRWIVLDPSDRKTRSKATCLCDCGTFGYPKINNLLQNHSQSCGCLDRERSRSQLLKHGLRNHRLYGIWRGIKDRCFNPRDPGFCWYGARGISMWTPWITDPKSFIEYVSGIPGHGDDGMSLDRIDNEGNYEPGNLRFADHNTQHRNTSAVVLTELIVRVARRLRGRFPVSELATMLQIKPSTLQSAVRGESWRDV